MKLHAQTPPVDTAAQQTAAIGGTAAYVSIAPFSLRDYQHDALAAMNAAWLRGIHRQAVQLPTGAGKTVVFAELLRRRPGRGVVLAHRDELIQQAAEKLRAVAPRLHIGIVKASANNVSADVVVASVQTLARPARLEQLAASGTFATVVVDEAHHAAAPSYRRVLDRLVGPDTLLVGVSATLKRGDNVRLDDNFQEVVFERGILEMIEQGWLSDIKGLQVKLATDFNALHSRAGDFVDNEIEQALTAANAPAVAVQAYQQHASGRRTIVFTPTVASAQAFSQAFTTAGIPSAIVYGAMPVDERRDTLARFHTGDVQVVCNCAVLTEGFDEPAVTCIIIARPTKSQPLYVQMVGRGTRLYPDKDDLLVIDLVGVTARHDLITTASLFGLEPQEIEHKTVTAAVTAQREQADAVAEAVRTTTERVDLFRRRTIHWTVANDAYTLAVSGGVINLREKPDGWTVEYVTRMGRSVVASSLDLGYAQGVAEDYARRAGGDALIRRDAPWRSRPPSDNQIAALLKWRINPRQVQTAGEASDLISAAVAGRGVRS